MTQQALFATSSPVYVDHLFTCESKVPQAFDVGTRHAHQWCHMWSEDDEALHAMARKIGLKREWFQDKASFPHYDLVPTKRELAIAAGAVVKPLIDFLREKKQEEANAK